jgi:hypothetical protein
MREQQQQGDLAQIDQVLEQYRAAYEARDINKLTTVWPSVDGNKALRNTFKNADRIHVTLGKEPTTISSSGEEATVRCREKKETVQSGVTDRLDHMITFKLRKNQGRWIIDSLQ